MDPTDDSHSRRAFRRMPGAYLVGFGTPRRDPSVRFVRCVRFVSDQFVEIPGVMPRRLRRGVSGGFSSALGAGGRVMLFQLFWIAVSVVSRETAREISALGLNTDEPPAGAALLAGAGVFCACACGVMNNAAAMAAGNVSHSALWSDFCITEALGARGAKRDVGSWAIGCLVREHVRRPTSVPGRANVG